MGIALCAGLAVFASMQRDISVALIEIEQPEQHVADILMLPRHDPSISDIESISSAPIFSDKRSIVPVVEEEEQLAEVVVVPVKEPEPEAPPPPEPPQLTMIGFLSNATSPASALITVDESNREQWVAVGDVIQLWRVEDITETGIVLSLGENQSTYNFIPR